MARLLSRCTRSGSPALLRWTFHRAVSTAPTRTLTTTVRVSGGTQPLVSVKTAAPIPKELLFDAMKVLRKLTVAAPVALGQVVMEDLCGTGIGVVAGKEVSAR